MSEMKVEYRMNVYLIWLYWFDRDQSLGGTVGKRRIWREKI